MEIGKKTIAQQTITSQVVENLRRDILSKQIPAGSHIGVKEIAERYGVSNMPVREAFFTLAAEKLIEMSPYKGAEVLPINRQFIADIYEIQGMLEELMNVNTMPLLTEEDMNRLKQINRQMQSVEDTPFGHQEYLRLNEMFHELVYEKSPNAFAAERWRYYHQIIRMLWTNYERVYDRMKQACEEHNKLIAAFEAQDADAVREIMHIHTDHAKETFLQQYSRHNTEN